MNETYNPKLIRNAQSLRRKMTKEERHLWYDFLKELPVNFNRQKIIGNYIVDFYCASAKLVIELDGSQHYEAEGRRVDAVRDDYMQSLGLTVKRYSNTEINQEFTSICSDILHFIYPEKA